MLSTLPGKQDAKLLTGSRHTLKPQFPGTELSELKSGLLLPSRDVEKSLDTVGHRTASCYIVINFIQAAEQDSSALDTLL